MKERIVHWAERFIRLPVVGLDISDRSIKYIRIAGSSRMMFEFFGEAEVPEGVITDGEVRREGDLADVLGELWRGPGQRLRPLGAVVSLPEEKSFLRLVQLPKVRPEEVAGAIRWQIEGQIPLRPEETIYDYEIIEPLADHLDHFDAVITAFPRGMVEAYVRALKAAGFQPVALELESQAIVRAAIRELRSPESRIVVDMGRARTSVIIAAGGAILFTATVAIGGRALEADIARALGADDAQAARLKKEVGLSKDAYEGKVFSALLPSIEKLAAELGRTVAYYEDHIKHTHGGSRSISSLLLSGGDANLHGLDTYLASRVRIPVEVADPFASMRERLGYVVPPIPRNEALAFTAAIGLALRGQEEKRFAFER